MLRDLPGKAHLGHPGDDVIGAWGRAYHCKATDPGARGGHYLIPTVFGCIEGELLRGVIVVHAYLSGLNKAVGHILRFALLKGSDSFERMRVSLDLVRSRLPNEIIRVIRGNWPSEVTTPTVLCPLLLASMADPNLPCLAELQTLILKCYPAGIANRQLAMGPALWPARDVVRLICEAADARLEEFKQLPLNTSFVQIKPRPLRWLSSSDLDDLESHAHWGSGDAAGLEQLWDQLEEADGLEEAEALLLQIVRLKVRHFTVPPTTPTVVYY